MSGFRVIYRQGSFACVARCATRDRAVAQAISLCSRPGVHHIRVEDERGRAVFNDFDLSSMPSGVELFPLAAEQPARKITEGLEGLSKPARPVAAGEPLKV